MITPIRKKIILDAIKHLEADIAKRKTHDKTNQDTLQYLQQIIALESAIEELVSNSFSVVQTERNLKLLKLLDRISTEAELILTPATPDSSKQFTPIE